MNANTNVEHKENMSLINESIDLNVKDLSGHSFHAPALLEMCDSASRDDVHGIKPIKGYPNHELWKAGKDGKFDEWETSKQIKYLLVHGFTPECIFSQAGM